MNVLTYTIDGFAYLYYCGFAQLIHKNHAWLRYARLVHQRHGEAVQSFSRRRRYLLDYRRERKQCRGSHVDTRCAGVLVLVHLMGQGQQKRNTK